MWNLYNTASNEFEAVESTKGYIPLECSPGIDLSGPILGKIGPNWTRPEQNSAELGFAEGKAGVAQVSIIPHINLQNWCDVRTE